MTEFLFRIPVHMAGHFEHGNLRVVGSVLQWTRDTPMGKAGQIASHFVQETGAAQSIVSRAVDFGSSLSTGGLPGTAAQIGTMYQNEQIKKRLDKMAGMLGGMQQLQVAALVSSVAGIGVTVASTVVILKRLNTVQGALEQRIGELPARLRDMHLERVLVSVHTQLERLADVSDRSDPRPVVMSAEEKLHDAFGHLHAGTTQILATGEIDAAMLRRVLEGLALCGSAQIKALIWMDEKKVARARAIGQARALEQISFEMPQDVLVRRCVERDAAAELSILGSELRRRIASLPALADTLIAHDVHGRDYLERAAIEEEEEFLFMPVVSPAPA